MTHVQARRALLEAAIAGGIAVSAALIAAPLPAVAASAPVIARDGAGILSYVGAPDDENMIVARDDEARLVVLISSRTTVTAGGGCVRIEPTVRRNKFDCGAISPITRLDVDMAAGGDSVTWQIPVKGIVRGGEGNDTFVPVPGLLPTPMATSVTIVGGDQNDTVDYSRSDGGVRVSLDNAQNDGRDGDLDNVFSDIENVTGSGFPDTIVGSAGRNTLTAGLGADTVVTNGGVDHVSTLDGVRDTVDCTASDAGVTLSADALDELAGCRNIP